jgi:glycosyltransferase involved in cell wall biosynthesis
VNIAVDLTVLQTPHRMRGIGATAINFINNSAPIIGKDHSYIFYIYEDEQSPLALLDLTDLNYEVRYITKAKKVNLKLPGKLRIINGAINQFREKMGFVFGDTRIRNTKGADVYFQFDQSQPLPAKRGLRTVLVLYDLIPYIMEADYLWSYSTARKNGKTRKGALRVHYHRKKYINRLKKATKKATHLIAISKHTKDDFVQYLSIKPSRITVCYLGISPRAFANEKDPHLKKFEQTSWGYVKRDLELKSKSYLLFVGGADPRRRLVELVSAFNNLRARGKDIKLVLAGDTMNGAFSVPNIEFQKYLAQTSYIDDIAFVGFINEDQRDWLYKNALAFVYPSVYEGFGLPVLEAMQYGCPVITYKNSSIYEIAGDAALYANDYLTIEDRVEALLSSNKLSKSLSVTGKEQAKQFSWIKTVRKIILEVSKTST